MAKIRFDHFAIPSLAIANQAVLALYSTGRTTGLLGSKGKGKNLVEERGEGPQQGIGEEGGGAGGVVRVGVWCW